MNNAGELKGYYSFMFGLITMVVSFSYDLFIRYVLKLHRDTENWVLWKWVLHALITLVLIATANYLYMCMN